MTEQQSDELSRWKHLSAEAEQGRLSLKVDPDAFTAIIKACADRLNVLDKARRDARVLQTLDGFGTLGSGVLLHGKYETKGHEIDDRLQQHIDIVNAMKDTFTKAHKAYTETDASVAASLGTIEP